ncbi:MAG: hypothetical protein ACFB9M_16700 [Myxococcota bacterium]
MTGGRKILLQGAVLAGLTVLGCSSGPRPSPDSATEEDFVRVRPRAEPGGNGSADTPYSTLQDALQSGAPRVLLEPGVHESSRPIRLTRSVEVFGGRGAGGAHVAASVVVSGSDVTLRNLHFGGGIEARFARRLTVEDATVHAGASGDAFNAYASMVDLQDVTVRGGSNTAIFVATSTLRLDRVRIDAARSRRGLFVTHGTCEATSVEISGGKSENVRLRGSRARVRQSVLRGSSQTGIAVVAGSSLTLGGVSVQATGEALWLESSQGEVEDSDLWSRTSHGLALRHGEVRMRNGHVASEIGPSVWVSGEAGPSRLEWDGGRMVAGRAGGLRVADARVSLRKLRVSSSTTADQVDAVVTSGPAAVIEVDALEFQGIGGRALVFRNDAGGHVASSTVSGCGGGVSVEGVWRSDLTLRGMRILGCGEEAGISVADARIRAESVQLRGCRLSIGGGADVQVSSFEVKDVLRGLEVFGGARLMVRSSTVSGRIWSAFCSPGAVIEGTSTRWAGPTNLCARDFGASDRNLRPSVGF